MLYHLLELSLRDPLLLYGERVMSGLFLYNLGLIVAFFLLRLRDIKKARKESVIISRVETLQTFHLRYFNWLIVQRDLRILHSISVMFVVFVNLKHLIPLINDKLYDSQLWELEKNIFNISPIEILHGLIPFEWAPFISNVYTVWYTYLAIVIMTMLLQRNFIKAEQFFIAFILMWFGGIALVYIWPTLGPCFYLPDVVAAMPITEITDIQRKLWIQRQFVLSEPMNDKGVYLISGLPSLHFAATLLGSLFLFKINKLLGSLSWIFCSLTFISTIYFGWHYLSDNIAAILLVMLAIKVAVFFRKNSEQTITS